MPKKEHVIPYYGYNGFEGIVNAFPDPRPMLYFTGYMCCPRRDILTAVSTHFKQLLDSGTLDEKAAMSGDYEGLKRYGHKPVIHLTDGVEDWKFPPLPQSIHIAHPPALRAIFKWFDGQHLRHDWPGRYDHVAVMNPLSWETLVDIYVLAMQWGMPILRNDVVDVMVMRIEGVTRSSKTAKLVQEKQLGPRERVIVPPRVWTDSPVSSPLWRFFVDFLRSPRYPAAEYSVSANVLPANVTAWVQRDYPAMQEGGAMPPMRMEEYETLECGQIAQLANGRLWVNSWRREKDEGDGCMEPYRYYVEERLNNTVYGEYEKFSNLGMD